MYTITMYRENSKHTKEDARDSVFLCASMQSAIPFLTTMVQSAGHSHGKMAENWLQLPGMVTPLALNTMMRESAPARLSMVWSISTT